MSNRTRKVPSHLRTTGRRTRAARRMASGSHWMTDERALEEIAERLIEHHRSGKREFFIPEEE